MSSVIQNLWQERKCPIINGVIWGDGTLTELKKITNSSIETTFFSKNRTLDIDLFIEEYGEYWTELIDLNQIVIEESNLEVIVGEGGMGSDGFVALLQQLNHNLIWLVFFDYSNPFINVSVNQNNIIAMTSLDKEWVFPINNPMNLHIY